MTASGHTLSRVTLVTASGRAGDYLPLLPARGQKSQNGWPDENRRRVLRRLSLSLLLFLKCRWQFLLRQEALFLSSLLSVVQDFARFFFEPVKILFPGSGVAGVAAPSAGSGFSCALRLLQLVQSHLVLRLRCLLEMVILLLPAAVPGVPGPMQRKVDSCSRGRQRHSPSGGFDWREVSRVAVSFACAFFSSSRKYYRSSSVFEVMDHVFFRPLLVAPSLEAPQRGSARFCG